MKLTKAEKLSIIVTVCFILASGAAELLRPQALSARVAPLSPAPQVSSAAPDTSDAQLRERICINTADSELLTSLPGIGDTLAGRIIAYRQEHGNFSSTEDIMKVSGIGPGIYEDIKAQICAGENGGAQ